jgi:hypothetical protein
MVALNIAFPAWQKTQRISIIKTNRSVLFREMIAVQSENRPKIIKKFCGRNSDSISCWSRWYVQKQSTVLSQIEKANFKCFRFIYVYDRYNSRGLGVAFTRCRLMNIITFLLVTVSGQINLCCEIPAVPSIEVLNSALWQSCDHVTRSGHSISVYWSILKWVH